MAAVAGARLLPAGGACLPHCVRPVDEAMGQRQAKPVPGPQHLPHHRLGGGQHPHHSAAVCQVCADGRGSLLEDGYGDLGHGVPSLPQAGGRRSSLPGGHPQRIQRKTADRLTSAVPSPRPTMKVMSEVKVEVN